MLNKNIQKVRVIIIIGLLLMCVVSCKAQESISTKSKRYFDDKKVLLLIEAAYENNISKVVHLLKNNVNVNCRGKNGITPLILLLSSASKNGMIALLEQGADANMRGISGDSAMTLAAGAKDTEFLEIMVRYGGDVNGVGDRGQTALLIAIHEKRWDNMRFLLDNGANIDSLGEAQFETPVMAAAGDGEYEQVYYLLSLGSNPAIINRFGYSLAHRLELPPGDGSVWKTKVKKLLVARGINLPAPKPEPYFEKDSR